jgi:hypothetical protein
MHELEVIDVTSRVQSHNFANDSLYSTRLGSVLAEQQSANSGDSDQTVRPGHEGWEDSIDHQRQSVSSERSDDTIKPMRHERWEDDIDHLRSIFTRKID